MKAIFQNLFFVIKRFKTASLLNVLGLAAAFAGFILIMIQLNYELGFDKYHSKSDDIYRVRLQFTNPENADEVHVQTLFVRNALDDIIENSPEIEKASLIFPFIGGSIYTNMYLTIDDSGVQRGFKEIMVSCYTDITDMFDFKPLEGSLDLSRPESVIIPESMAKRMFGASSAIGKSIHFDEYIRSKSSNGTRNLNLVITGVYKDFPKNTQIKNYLYTAMDKDFAKSPNDWSTNNLFYVQLAKGADPKKLENIFSERGDVFPEFYQKHLKLIVDKLTDVYYSEGNNEGYTTGEFSTSILLIAIGVLIIVVAVINSINFNIALAPRRLKNINIRKILGSSNKELRYGLVIESVLISLLSFTLALALVYVIASMDLMPFIETDISQSSYLLVALTSFIIAILTGLVAGIQPAFYMTSFALSEALKGKSIFSSSGFKARTVLIGFQFLVAIILVSFTILMNMQFSFMQNYKLGFDTDQVAVVELNEDFVSNNRAKYEDKLKLHPSIIDVAYSGEKLGASDSYSQYSGMLLNGKGNYHYSLLSVSWNFLNLMNIDVLEGRRYTERDANSSETSLIINKKTHEETGAKVGDSFAYEWSTDMPQRVVGIVDNIQFTSLRNEMQRMVFTLNDKNGHHILPISYIKIAAGANVRELVSHIEKTITSIDPSYPVKIEFYDEIYNELYKRENKLSSSVSIFSLLAIIIAIMGVFGLVMFEGEYRRKEIALRKVMGSTIAQVLTLFNKGYVKIFAISFILSLPVIYYAINKWLEQFAYKTELHWWIFLLGGGIVLLVVILTVSLQSYRSAIVNPSDALKNE